MAFAGKMKVFSGNGKGKTRQSGNLWQTFLLIPPSMLSILYHEDQKEHEVSTSYFQRTTGFGDLGERVGVRMFSVLREN